jgi:amino acid transporter
MGERDGGLRRHFGLWQAVALNVSMVVGAGVFILIPQMLQQLPGAWALAAWLGTGLLVLLDGLVWSELGAAMPGSGGSYVYLLESFGRQRWGRLMAFLFIWQFLLSGPLELASGFIAIDGFLQGLSKEFADFNNLHAWKWTLSEANQLAVTISPARVGCALLAVGLVVLLYRRVEALGRLTLLFALGVLVASGWIIVEGIASFDMGRAFHLPDAPAGFTPKLGQAMVLAIYCYLGYYNICYIGDEVHHPSRTIPRAVLLSVLIVGLLFVALHLSMLGTVSWQDAVAGQEKLKDDYNLPADFMARARGQAAVRVVLLVLIGSCTASAFAGLLAYARVPYGAARAGHFFAAVGRAHPTHGIPHVSLVLIGACTAFWCFFDLSSVVNAFIATRIPTQFVAQTAGLMLLWRTQPTRERPYRMLLYPLPCLLAIAGWLFVYAMMGWAYIAFSAVAMAAGVVAFLAWSGWSRTWPFGPAEDVRLSDQMAGKWGARTWPSGPAEDVRQPRAGDRESGPEGERGA